MTKPRRMRERRNWAWLAAITLVKPTLRAFTRHEWIDGDKLPATGGCVVVANHVSHIDPLTYAHLFHDNGRLPRILAKEALFDVPVLGTIMKSTGQIPVARQTSNAAHAFEAAVQGVKGGKLVFFYPEGTLTRDPDLWPMVGKSGAVRVALEAGSALIPVAQWGQQHILYPYAKRPHLIPRRLVRIKVGDPVDLDDLRGQEITTELLHEGTDRMMTAITSLLEDLRGERAPKERFDPKKHGVAPIGNPHKKPQLQPGEEEA
ncbi:MAG: lysophospholipid acyltransferase family protein [Nocardioidaceae bacterium]